MSEPGQPDGAASDQRDLALQLEVLPARDGDALPVLAPAARVVRRSRSAGALSWDRIAPVAVPVAQAAAVAAGGFVTGAALVGLAQRCQRRALVAKARRRGHVRSRSIRSVGGSELVQIVGSRSLLVDVHLLGGRD